MTISKRELTKDDLKKLINILSVRCNLNCTEDALTNVMTYDQWIDYILNEFNLFDTKYSFTGTHH